jgi:hypothetical protein
LENALSHSEDLFASVFLAHIREDFEDFEQFELNEQTFDAFPGM